MSKQIEVNEEFVALEKMEVALNKLQTLRNKLSELINHCEELKKISKEAESKLILCGMCRGEIAQGQEVIAKDSTGKHRYYHLKCFLELW